MTTNKKIGTSIFVDLLASMFPLHKCSVPAELSESKHVLLGMLPIEMHIVFPLHRLLAPTAVSQRRRPNGSTTRRCSRRRRKLGASGDPQMHCTFTSSGGVSRKKEVLQTVLDL